MCIGIPLRIEAVTGTAAVASDGRQIARIDLSETGPVAPGTWVLTHLGAAWRVIDGVEARRIRTMREGLRAALEGEAPNDQWQYGGVESPKRSEERQITR